MTEEEIENLKDKIWEGVCAAPDRRCRDGFSAANKLIEYYENELSRHEIENLKEKVKIATVYEELLVLSNKIKAEANKK